MGLHHLKSPWGMPPNPRNITISDFVATSLNNLAEKNETNPALRRLRPSIMIDDIV